MFIDLQAIERWRAFDAWWMNHFGWVYERGLDIVGESRLARVVPHIRGTRVLEVSFGVGYLLTKCAANYEVTGIDYNPVCVARAKRRLSRFGLQARLLEADVHALPFDAGSFDTVLCTDAFSLYREPEQALKEMLRVLAPGGRLIATEYDDPRDNNVVGRLYARMMRRVFGVPRFDSLGVFSSAGLPFEDHDLGSFGMLHLFIIDKKQTEREREREPLRQDSADPQL